MLWALLVLCVVLWAAITRCRQKAVLKKCNLTEWKALYFPFVGNSLQFFGNSEHHMNTLIQLGRSAIEEEGGTLGVWMGNDLYVAISDPSNAEFVLKTCLGKGKITLHLKFLTGNGSLFAPVDIWRRRRKIVSPGFSQNNLDWFVDNVFARQSDTMARLLRARAGAGPFSLWPYLTSYTFDSICETAAGIDFRAQELPNNYLHYLDEAMDLSAHRMVSPWLYSDAVFKLTSAYAQLKKRKETVYDYLQQIISPRLEKSGSNENASERTPNDSPTFLNTLTTKGTSPFSMLELCEEGLLLLIAGNDTSAVGSSFTALMLAKHQHVQDKVYRELVEVFGDSELPVSATDLPRLRYLECVIKESLRLYPPVPSLLRNVDRDITLPSGQIPKDSTAVVIPDAVHRNPRFWGADAAEFRPERFLDTKFVHPAQFIPFSYGPRNCTGYRYGMMSMKTALATLLREFKILPAKEEQPVKVRYCIMMKDADNCLIQLEKRSNTL